MHLSITELSHLATWSYLVIALVAAGDAVIPVLPAETLVILGGILAARGDLSIGLVVVAAAVGATLGDNGSYQIGHGANRSGKRPEEISGRFGRALGWAEAALAAKGTSMLIIGRFLPAGRTALTLGAGYVRYPRARFAATSLVAASIWASYGAAIGFVGGKVFVDRWWAALGIGLLGAGVVTLVIELGRRLTGHGGSIADKRVELQARRDRVLDPTPRRTGCDA